MRRQTRERVLECGTADTRHHRYKLVSVCEDGKECKQIFRILKKNLKTDSQDDKWEFVEAIDGAPKKRHVSSIEFQRLAIGMTVAQLAEASGVPARVIYKAENGNSKAGNMTAKNLLAIADTLEVDPRLLLED